MASRAEAPGRTFTGREAELAVVREVLDRAADGQSETLLVFGEAGVGKTALVPPRGGRSQTTDVAAEWSLPSIAVDQRAVASAPSGISRIDGPAVAASMAA